ncbi:GIY-YIG nuclease family protein [Winogradskyella maritima]|uniref:GIY-YIG nuclease family protein n=1 Tax=Winogradskyella maritima TaxID=1517766 RepID=A0ABV8ALG2_9FLAO|nr:GIY-YIG nuclease family protein [Winogradskyella maritima]
MYYVYILHSERFDKYYKGQTGNFPERIKRHNAGMEKSTAPYRPWTPIWVTQKPTKSEAVKLERKLKNLSREKTLSFIEKFSQDKWKP